MLWFYSKEESTAIMSENVKQKRSPLIFIVIILLLIIVAGGGYFGYEMVAANKAAAPKTEITYSLDDFLINTADTGEKRYIKTKIYIGYTESKLTAELDTKKPILRDTVNSILYSKKASEMNQAGLEVMKKEIIEKLNKSLTNGKIENVYYYDVILQ